MQGSLTLAAGRLARGRGGGGRPSQLDVLRERMKNEYAIPIDYECTRFTLAHWVMADTRTELDRFVDGHRSSMAKDLDGALVFMAPTTYGLKYEEERWPDVRFADIKTYQARDGGLIS